jgi:hypothetical protein
LSRGYVTSLTQSLRSRAISLDANVLQDAVTLRTLAGAGINRGELLAAMAERAAAPDAGSIDFAGGDATMWGTQTMTVQELREGRDAASDDIAVDRVLRDVADLRSGNPDRLRRVLRRSTRLDRHLVPYVISLLARNDVSSLAVSALHHAVDSATGQIVDMLMDADASPVIRRRLPQVLAGSRSPIAIAGLLHALDDAEFEVRFRSAGALMRSREAHPGLGIPRETVFAAAVREARRASPLLQQVASNPADHRSLELVFRILSLAFDPEPLKLAQRALRSDDPQLRGTALEYLETVLPANVFEELRPVFGAPFAGTSGRTRTAKELESELLTSSAAMSINVAPLRQKLQENDE